MKGLTVFLREFEKGRVGWGCSKRAGTLMEQLLAKLKLKNWHNFTIFIAYNTFLRRFRWLGDRAGIKYHIKNGGARHLWVKRVPVRGKAPHSAITL
jgi:hypothetical protein